MAARDDYPGLVAMTQDMEAADAWTHEAWAALAEIDRLRAEIADIAACLITGAGYHIEDAYGDIAEIIRNRPERSH